MDHSKEFQELLKTYLDLEYIKPSKLPNIDLYMDQVTTFMDEALKNSKRYPEDKVLTKTMINNYTKNNLLPPTDKKKYTSEHMIFLIFIYYLKSILSINDIQTLLAPLQEKYFNVEEGMDLKDIYRSIISMEARMFRPFYRDILRKVDMAEHSFEEEPEENRDYLQQFSMVCMLAYDVYLKKQMIEKIVDGMDRDAKEKAAAQKNDKKHKKGDV